MKSNESPFEKKREWLFFLSKNRKISGKENLSEENQKNDTRDCKGCGATYTLSQWSNSLYVCNRCGKHHFISSYERLYNLLDPHSFAQLSSPEILPDPLNFPDYAQKCESIQEKTGLEDAVISCVGELDGHEVCCVVLDNRFLMGSMGSYVGEAVAQATEYAQEKKIPLIIFSSSGGARMQEGIFSLLQMAKTSAILEEFSQQGGLYISYLTHPTTGGVTASFASLGDIILAEPDALIGFAGPRVIEQTIRKKLPQGFQRAEYLEEHGFVDQIVPRKHMKKTLTQLVKLHGKGGE